MTKTKPKIFICHASNDKEASVEWLEKIDKALESKGFEVQYDLKLKAQGTIELDTMMRKWITELSDFIIPVMTLEYYNKSNESNTGTDKELRLMNKFLNHDTLINKIIPIKKSNSANFKRPITLANIWDSADFSDEQNFKNSLNELIERLSSNPEVRRAEVSNKKDLRRYLEKLNYHVGNIDDNTFLDEETILLYPVVARNNMNIIHKGQIELLIYLAKNLNWKIEILISEFKKINEPLTKSISFKKEIEKFIGDRDKIENISYSFSSEYLNNENQDYTSNNEVEKLTTLITLQQLTDIIVKEDYPPRVKDEKRNKDLQNALRPIRIMAITSYLSIVRKSKIIVLAGKDEELQWEIIYNHNKNIGAILIPTLKLKTDDNVVHDSLTKNDVHSRSKVKSQLKKGNFFQWVLQVFVALNHSKFENDICNESLKSGSDKFKDTGKIDHDILADKVFELIRKR